MQLRPSAEKYYLGYVRYWHLADMSSRQLLTQTVAKPITEQVPLLRICRKCKELASILFVRLCKARSAVFIIFAMVYLSSPRDWAMCPKCCQL